MILLMLVVIFGCGLNLSMLFVISNISADPRQILAHGGVSCVVFAIFHNETGNSVHSPRAITVSTHQRTARIPSASVRVGSPPESHTHHFVVVTTQTGSY